MRLETIEKEKQELKKALLIQSSQLNLKFLIWANMDFYKR